MEIMSTLDKAKSGTALKIGILTFHRCINYGSYWQARCLAEGLQARGHQAEILDHESRRVNLAEWKCAFRPVLPSPVPDSDYPLYRSKIEKFFQAFDTLPLSPRFPLDEPHKMESYDVIVVGSDEVWNLSHPWYARCSLFYGDNLKARQVISYAASFGNYDASHGLEQYWAEKLRNNFRQISVRDENSRTILRNALGFAPEMVLDPCLQFPVKPEERSLERLQEPYLALYGHNFSDSFIREARQWANRRKLPLISIGYRNEWADEQWLTADPHDFAHFIARSQAVVTNFFHGCVFALAHAKPFACETSPYRSHKLQGLMAKVGGEKHLLSPGTSAAAFDACLGNPLKADILHSIEQMRKSSHAYLDKALPLTEKQYA